MDKEKNSYGSCAGCGGDLTPEDQSINDPTYCNDCDPELIEDDDYECEVEIEEDDDCDCGCDEEDEDDDCDCQ